MSRVIAAETMNRPSKVGKAGEISRSLQHSAWHHGRQADHFRAEIAAVPIEKSLYSRENTLESGSAPIDTIDADREDNPRVD